MDVLLKLLNDDLINKKKLLIKNYKILGLNEQQVLLFLKLIDLDEKSKVTINTIAKYFEISKIEAEQIISNLINLKLIKIKHTKEEMIFNLDFLWKKLLLIYYPPNELETDEVKFNWFVSQLNLKITPIVKKEISNWINSGNWSKMVSIVEFLVKNQITKIEWKTLKTIYMLEIKEKTLARKKIKEIVDKNWLID